MEAAKGCTKDLNFYMKVPCGRCNGSKAEPGTKRTVCPYCRGSGTVSGLPSLVGEWDGEWATITGGGVGR